MTSIYIINNFSGKLNEFYKVLQALALDKITIVSIAFILYYRVNTKQWSAVCTF